MGAKRETESQEMKREKEETLKGEEVVTEAGHY